jgi:hypothetical protein
MIEQWGMNDKDRAKCLQKKKTVPISFLCYKFYMEFLGIETASPD